MTFVRTLLGTTAYAIIIVLAAPFPGAAGLFLTFPALNGLGFFFSPRENVEPMAKSMLWMPVINGTLCAAYIGVFLMLGQVMLSQVMLDKVMLDQVMLDQVVAPTMLAWILVIAAAGVWFAVVSRRTVRDGIARTHQLIYGIVVLLVGCALMAIVARLLSSHGVGSAWTSQVPITQAPITLASITQAPISFDLLLQILWQSRLKVALFALCLLLFLVLTARLPVSPDVRGILAGLPIVPFGGLVSVAGDSGIDLGERLHIFERMALSVWLGPAIAIAFIYGYSKYLDARRPLKATALDSTMRFAVLTAAWLLCGLAMLGIGYALSYVGPAARNISGQ